MAHYVLHKNLTNSSLSSDSRQALSQCLAWLPLQAGESTGLLSVWLLLGNASSCQEVFIFFPASFLLLPIFTSFGSSGTCAVIRHGILALGGACGGNVGSGAVQPWVELQLRSTPETLEASSLASLTIRLFLSETELLHTLPWCVGSRRVTCVKRPARRLRTVST